MEILAFVLFLTVMQCGWVSTEKPSCNDSGKCDKNGVGLDTCIQFKHYYNSYQCATCVNSNDQHNCAGFSSTQYCWFPCMLQPPHNETSGEVADDCKCTPPITPTSSADSRNCGLYGVIAVSIILMNIFAAFPY